ncbi:MAG: hypothetical protein IJB21_02560 [Bacilli bacterium]|nr:hypothetical protein [Bacilli bacterium]
MKNKTIINDERVYKESNSIYKICFQLVCLLLLFDVIFKFYYYNTFVAFNNGEWISYMFELLILIILLYLVLFVHAYKGILVYAIDLPNDTFQIKRSLKISLVVSSFISILAFILPVIIIELFIGIPEMPFSNLFMIYCLLALGCFVILFILFNVNFYLAYLLAKYKNNIKKYDELDD